jgi:uncharacterized protein
MDFKQIQHLCSDYLSEIMAADPAHDISHVRRVVQNTIGLTRAENGNPAITVPAAWLHDCVSVPKDSPLRGQASRLAADEAVRFLKSIDYPAELLQPIHHAIEAHSFSADLDTATLEARIVQDADRLEAIGAIGITRCFLTGGSMGTPLYEPSDPFAQHREPDDRQFTLDHFYCKLLGLTATMKTDAGRAEAEMRTQYMHAFLRQLATEIGHPPPGA